MNEKIFFWSVKEMTNDYWTMYSIWIQKDDLEKLVFNDKWWANVSMKKWRSWNWYMEVYVPNWVNNNQSQKEKVNNVEETEDEELPF